MVPVLYRFLAALARLAVRSGRSKDLEIIVLRRQVQVLRRQLDRAALTDGDRTLLGAIAAALPRRLGKGGSSHPRRCCAGTASASPDTGPSKHTPVIMLIDDLDIRVIATNTGELLRALTLDRNRGYQPRFKK